VELEPCQTRPKRPFYPALEPDSIAVTYQNMPGRSLSNIGVKFFPVGSMCGGAQQVGPMFSPILYIYIDGGH
jgi:hypothetical protein